MPEGRKWRIAIIYFLFIPADAGFNFFCKFMWSLNSVVDFFHELSHFRCRWVLGDYVFGAITAPQPPWFEDLKRANVLYSSILVECMMFTYDRTIGLEEGFFIPAIKSLIQLHAKMPKQSGIEFRSCLILIPRFSLKNFHKMPQVAGNI